jgi:hypothetical protein
MKQNPSKPLNYEKVARSDLRLVRCVPHISFDGLQRSLVELSPILHLDTRCHHHRFSYQYWYQVHQHGRAKMNQNCSFHFARKYARTQGLRNPVYRYPCPAAAGSRPNGLRFEHLRACGSAGHFWRLQQN